MSMFYSLTSFTPITKFSSKVMNYTLAELCYLVKPKACELWVYWIGAPPLEKSHFILITKLKIIHNSNSIRQSPETSLSASFSSQ